jgi:hypothetical protein
MFTSKKYKDQNYRPFLPHFNLKEKLAKLKYKGNYGTIFKKSNNLK